MAHTPSRSVAFQQVDVFTALPFKGNPVAVILDGNDLSTSQMQSIAAWTKLSETTFVCTPTHPDADYRLRIFTPRSEMPFAGHPTIGSAWALLRHGLQPQIAGRLIQECGQGLIRIRLEGSRLFLALPEPVFMVPTDAQLAAAASALGLGSREILRSSLVDVGPTWFTLQLASAQQVLMLAPNAALLAALGGVSVVGVTVFGFYGPGHPDAIEVRSFAPAFGVPEDPVCGSGNGCVAAIIRREGLLTGSTYSAAQGRCLGRAGHVAVVFDVDGTIWLGGQAVTCIQGSITV